MQSHLLPSTGPGLTAVKRGRRRHIEAVLAPPPHREAPAQQGQTTYRTPTAGGLLRGVLAVASLSSWWPGTAARPEAQSAADVVVDAAEQAVEVRPAAWKAAGIEVQARDLLTLPQSQHADFCQLEQLALSLITSSGCQSLASSTASWAVRRGAGSSWVACTYAGMAAPVRKRAGCAVHLLLYRRVVWPVLGSACGAHCACVHAAASTSARALQLWASDRGRVLSRCCAWVYWELRLFCAACLNPPRFTLVLVDTVPAFADCVWESVRL